MLALYDLAADIGETRDISAAHPDIVTELQRKLAGCREDLGDVLTGVVGRNTRPKGQVANPQTLTTYDPNHPYFAAEYDLSDRG
jgi:hypothetical protein